MEVIKWIKDNWVVLVITLIVLILLAWGATYLTTPSKSNVIYKDRIVEVEKIVEKPIEVIKYVDRIIYVDRPCPPKHL